MHSERTQEPDDDQLTSLNRHKSQLLKLKGSIIPLLLAGMSLEVRMKTDKTEIGVNKTFRTKVENDFPFFIEKVVSLTDLFEATNCMQIGLKKAH